MREDAGDSRPGVEASDDDVLARLRDRIDAVAEVDVEDRVELFEQVDATLAAELAALDEV